MHVITEIAVFTKCQINVILLRKSVIPALNSASVRLATPSGKSINFLLRCVLLLSAFFGIYCPLNVCGHGCVVARCFIYMKNCISHYSIIFIVIFFLSRNLGFPKGRPLWLIRAFLAKVKRSVKKMP